VLVLLGDSSHGFFSALLRGVAETLPMLSAPDGKHLHTIINNHDDKPWVEEASLRTFLTERVSGLIIAPASSLRSSVSLLESYMIQNIPVIQVDRKVNGLGCAWVGIDNTQAAAAATKHLRSHGHDRISLIGGRPNVTTNQLRFDGYADAMSGAGADFRELIRWNCSEWDTTKATVGAMLAVSKSPTAFLCLSGMATLGTVLAIRDAKLSCPGDIAVIGFDDNPWCRIPTPGLTMIRQPARRIGEQAAQLVWQGFNGDLVPSDHFIQWELVQRGSCGC
jgi:DNA-binding LacI/PurR family transcriptional regulator